MSFSSSENRLIKKTTSYDRLIINNNSKFTVPETASLVCKGGAILNGGIQLGNNEGTADGTLRYNKNGLQIRDNEFKKVATYNPISEQKNSIIKFSSDGTIDSTNITVSDSSGSILNGVTEIKTANQLKFSNGTRNINFLAKPPTSTSSSGNKGDFAWDDNHIYIYTSVGWKRSNLTTF